MSCWIDLPATSGDANLGWDGVGSSSHRFSLSAHAGTLTFYTENGSTNSPNVAVSAAGAVHYIAVFDGSKSGATRQALYVNGVPVTLTAGGSGPPSTYTVTGAFIGGNDAINSRYSAIRN